MHGAGGGGVNFNYKVYADVRLERYTFEASMYMNGYHFHIKSISMGRVSFSPEKVYEWVKFEKKVYEWVRFSLWEVHEWVCFYTPVFRRDVLWYGDVRPSVRPSGSPSIRPSVRHSFPHFSPTCFDILI